MADTTTEVCAVCGEALESDSIANCAFCGRNFHITWDTRKPLKDCGRFDLDEESLGRFFTCNPCLQTLGGPQRTLSRS